MAGIDVCTKKIFTAVSRRLSRAPARSDHAKEAVSMRVTAFMSQLELRRSPYFMRTSAIVCLLMRN
jgi:hypothetical protein